MNIVKQFIIIKKPQNKFLLFYFFYNYKKNRIINNSLLLFYSFFFKYLYLLSKIYNYRKLSFFNFIFLINLKNKHSKINLIDVYKNKTNTFSIGLVLKILQMYKKNNRRNTLFLKYIVNYLLKIYFNDLLSSKLILVFNGLLKNYLKIIYYFKIIIKKFQLSLILFKPLLNNLKWNTKKKRSIKRRIFKKLVNFNNKF